MEKCSWIWLNSVCRILCLCLTNFLVISPKGIKDIKRWWPWSQAFNFHWGDKQTILIPKPKLATERACYRVNMQDKKLGRPEFTMYTGKEFRQTTSLWGSSSKNAVWEDWTRIQEFLGAHRAPHMHLEVRGQLVMSESLHHASGDSTQVIVLMPWALLSAERFH